MGYIPVVGQVRVVAWLSAHELHVGNEKVPDLQALEMPDSVELDVRSGLVEEPYDGSYRCGELAGCLVNQ